MVQRRQRGWLKKESRIPGETWVLYFRTTRKSDGRRVENKIPIGLIRDLPDKRTAWAEVERLHLPINPVDSRRGGHTAHSLLGAWFVSSLLLSDNYMCLISQSENRLLTETDRTGAEVEGLLRV
jgi:hypothetical protein